MIGQFLLYHAAPLHYVPHILSDGAIYAQSILAARNIAPRKTAFRRDRALGLTDYVHLSLKAETPLLADKIKQGYPHVLIIFPADEIFSMTETALIPYNTKAWRHKKDFRAVTDPVERSAMLDRHRMSGDYPSLEVLVKYGLGLDLAYSIAFATEEELGRVEHLVNELNILHKTPLEVVSGLFPGISQYSPTTLPDIADYFERCVASRTLLPPPVIPFD